MSMVCELQTLKASSLDTLLAAPERVAACVAGTDDDLLPSRRVDLEKNWHAIHFTLTGKEWGADGDLGLVVLGGQGIGEDMGYGPVRYLTPAQVQSVAAALRAMPPEQFSNRFNPEALGDADIYPGIWDDEDPEELLEEVLQSYEALCEFYFEAAARGNAVLVHMR